MGILRKYVQKQWEQCDHYVNVHLEKFHRPILAHIEMKKAELVNKTSTQHQKLAAVHNRIKKYKEKLLQEERFQKTRDEKTWEFFQGVDQTLETIVNCLQGRTPMHNEIFAEAPYKNLQEVFDVKTCQIFWIQVSIIWRNPVLIPSEMEVTQKKRDCQLDDKLFSLWSTKGH